MGLSFAFSGSYQIVVRAHNGGGSVEDCWGSLQDGGGRAQDGRSSAHGGGGSYQ